MLINRSRPHIRADGIQTKQATALNYYSRLVHKPKTHKETNNNNMSLSLHCGATPVTRVDVDNTKTPPPAGRHHPIPHGMFLDCITKQLHHVDIDITETRLGLTHDGNRLFGTFEIEKRTQQTEMFSSPETGGTFTNLVGFRNSHDQSFAASLVAGGRVFVCDNLMLHGEIKMNRKHTRFIERDLPNIVGHMVLQLFDKWLHQEVRYDAYADTELNNEQAHDLMMLGFRNGCIPGSKINRVIECWDTPTHDEFAPRNAWSLFNCFTEAQKSSPSMIPVRSMALHNTFNGYCNTAIMNLAEERGVDLDPDARSEFGDISNIEDAEILV
tara:strand:- start:6407 stop:7387 length:981 start_codon:yes stop_codon:yes gene_type:complete